MTIDEIEAGLLWGFHDADLLRHEVDFATNTAVFDLSVPIDEQQTTVRPGRLTVSGVHFVSVSPPLNPEFGEALWIDSSGSRWERDPIVLPAIPDGLFLHTFFRKNPAVYIHVAAREASFRWLGEGSPAGEERPKLYYPGQSIP